MHDLKWSAAEKQLARRAFDSALTAELAELVAAFKTSAAAVTTVDEVWSIQERLVRRRREIDEKYDYRYSRLLFVFGWLLRERRLSLEQLAGLSQDKLEILRRMASL